MRFPPDFSVPAAKAAAAYRASVAIAHLVPERRAVVQAGGCSGLWPIFLATQFARVYTFEPDPINFQCLQANVAAHPKIAAYDFAVGDTNTYVGMTRPKVGAGLWRVDGEGDIPMVPIDDVIGDEPIDAIVLDVEGSEVRALKGAERVINTHHPLLWFEFLHHTEEIAAFLAAHGYVPPRPALGGDAYSVHLSRVQ